MILGNKVNREMSELRRRIRYWTEMSELNKGTRSTVKDRRSVTGSWCAYQDVWNSGSEISAVLSDTKLFHEDSNMIRNAYAYIKNGVSRTHAGVYLITFQLSGANDPNEQTWVYITRIETR